MTKHKKTSPSKDSKEIATKRPLPIKAALVFLYYLLLPGFLVFLSVRFFSFTNEPWLATIYVITLASIVLFYVFKFHHCKINNLAYVLGLLLSPLYAFISDARWIALSRALLGENWFDISYPSTTIAILFYTFPIAFVAIIVLIIVLVMRARKKILDINK